MPDTELPQTELIDPPQADARESAPVEIHKPKPVHSWRELLTEIGVIVIGVMVALGAEQAVEHIHWGGQVSEARDLLGNELAQSMNVSIYRVRLEDCIEGRLDALTAIVDGASQSGSLRPVPQIGNAPDSGWPDDVWHAVVASQTATHFPPDTLNGISAAYTHVAEMRTWNREELLVWARLSTMAGPGRRLDPASEADAVGTQPSATV